MKKKADVLVIGSTGKTGSRVLSRLKNSGLTVREGSRSSEIPFDWENPETWTPALTDVTSVYITFYPDLAVPGADEAIQALVDIARNQGVKRLVLLSGRGEEGAQICEKVVQESGLEWTIVRASFFMQNLSEDMLVASINSGVLALPVGGVREPFIDAEDIADVVTAALIDDKHVGTLYEVTGPRLMTFSELTSELSEKIGKDIQFISVTTEQMAQGLEDEGLPKESALFISELMATVLDGRNESLSHGVEEALGRSPRDFKEFVQDTVISGVWG
jgi:uncharacterized protein YbjT (DUF2867 family)